ncbi:hypothetical protein ACFONG_04675 [Uliginosibacterium paludis]|uniref:Uncharacterized protein n=1 Tax=Uliginosibacterium paludis TaxID=1615952 RepID=A0ABV2CPA3_9RHOO
MFAARTVATGTLALILAACGGGGGGGGNETQPVPVSGSSASSSSSASSASSSSAGNAASSSASSASSSQGSAEAGSTTLTGNDFEGIWVDRLGFPALISPEGSVYQDGDDTNLTGSISFTADTWQLGSQTTNQTSSLKSETATGSGSFSPKKLFSGTVHSTGAGGTRDIAVSWTYSSDNDRAVSLASLAGAWQDLTIDANGNLSGLIVQHALEPGACQYSGKIEPVTQGSSKNLFKFSLTRSAVPGKTCSSTRTDAGFAAVMSSTDSSFGQMLVGVANNTSTGERSLEFYWSRLK